MKYNYIFRLLLIAVFSTIFAQTILVAEEGGLSAEYLRCEYKVDPLGIDEMKPRLSWIVKSSQRGQKQTAYRILVSSSSEKLENDQGDLWDSGKVNSDETIRIDYAGRQLKSHMQCFWKVKVWGVKGKESQWSKSTLWSMGILGKWQGRWIGYDTRESELFKKNNTEKKSELANDKWVWDAESLKDGNVPAASGSATGTGPDQDSRSPDH